MGALSRDLEEMGYERTGEESPFDEDGMLWSNGVEAVCDETALVIRSNDRPPRDDWSERKYFRYPNSSRVRMVGGFFGSYDWGYDDEEGRFRY